MKAELFGKLIGYRDDDIRDYTIGGNYSEVKHENNERGISDSIKTDGQWILCGYS